MTAKHKKREEQKQEATINTSFEPFYIKAGDDSLEQIFSSLPCGFSDVDMAMLFNQSAVTSIEKITSTFESLFGNYVNTNHAEDEIDRKKNEHPEKIIDKAKEAALLRLQYYLKEKELH